MRHSIRLALASAAFFSVCAVSGCGGVFGAMFGMGALESVNKPQRTQVDPSPIPAQDANLVVLVETTGNPDISTANISLGNIVLRTASGSTRVLPINDTLPVDVATLDGNCVLVSATVLQPGETYTSFDVQVTSISLVDSFGRSHTVTAPAGASITVNHPLTPTVANTLIVSLDLANDLTIHPTTGAASWTGDIETDVVTFDSGNYDLAVLPVMSVSGIVADTQPANGSIRLIVDPAQTTAVRVMLRPGTTIENINGIGQIVNPASDIAFTFWPQQICRIDGIHVTPGVDTPGVPVPLPRPTDEDDYGEQADDVIVDGGASRVAHTTWDPLMRGIVSAVYPSRFEMLVITTIGPGSPDVFSIVDVTVRDDAVWLFQGDKMLEPAWADLAVGQEVLVNTLPMGSNLFDADRVEFLETVVHATITGIDASGHPLYTLSRIEGVEPSKVHMSLTRPILVEGPESKPVSLAYAGSLPALSIHDEARQVPSGTQFSNGSVVLRGFFQPGGAHFRVTR